MYSLDVNEEKRLLEGIRTTLAMPFVDDLEDYVWKAVFAYTKGLSLASIRTKRLFDVVDTRTGMGWSAKALQWTIRPSTAFELVVQRADVLKKRQLLGFPELSLQSEPQQLGAALLKHWYGKVETDAIYQQVTQKRVCILLKSRDRTRFSYYEDDLTIYPPEQLQWRWTDEQQNGLRALDIQNGFAVFRWYPNQKQLFERFQLAEDAVILNINVKQLPFQAVIQNLSTLLSNDE